MKKIEAIVRPEKVDEVRRALEKAGYPGVTISEVEGHGKQKGVTRQWRGESYKVDLLPKVLLTIFVDDKQVKKITRVILKSARTGAIGDGKLFVSPVDNVIRIRTGEEGPVAI